ncbi:CUE domain-containing protein 1 [Cricetulus griseus]|nr:CUE domain-containing protein 1 [Cricetulus griseus]
MDDFKTMFPNMDYDIIECVLRANSGAVDATIDQLLQMNLEAGGGSTYEDSSDSEDSIPPESPDCAGHLSGFRNTSFLFLKLDENSHPCLHENSGSDLTSGPGLLAPPTSLFLPCPVDAVFAQLSVTFSSVVHPFDLPGLVSGENTGKSRPFLLKGGGHPGGSKPMGGERGPAPVPGSGACDQDSRWKQYLEDERIALFLQNEEFMKELQRNRDFLLALERDRLKYESQKSKSSNVAAGNDLGLPSSVPGTSDTNPTVSEDALFRDKLKHMGKSLYMIPRLSSPTERHPSFLLFWGTHVRGPVVLFRSSCS